MSEGHRACEFRFSLSTLERQKFLSFLLFSSKKIFIVNYILINVLRNLVQYILINT